MLFFATLLLLSASVSAVLQSAVVSRVHPLVALQRRVSAPITNDTIEFLTGVALGLETDFAGNLTDCLKDESTVMDDFNLAFGEITHGLEHFSSKDVEKGLRDMALGVKAIRAAFEDCGTPQLLADLARIEQKLASGPLSWLELLASEIANILSHRQSFGHQIREAIKAWDRQEFRESGYNIGLMLGILIQDEPSK